MGHGMAYDSKRGRVVLFGGYVAGSPLGDTWEFDGERWERKSESGPSPRGALGIAYDSARGKTVLFGGSAGWEQAKFTDTWEWDGTTWARVAVVGPGGNRFHRMAYDARRGRIVSFGGRGGGGETWEWDGSHVAESQRRWAPTSRSSCDDVRQRTRARRHVRRQRATPESGGYPPPESYIWLSDLWEWDGARWTPLAAQGPPSKGGQPGLAYDDHRHRLMLVGGGGGLAGTWVWAGGKWEQIRDLVSSGEARHRARYNLTDEDVARTSGSGRALRRAAVPSDAAHDGGCYRDPGTRSRPDRRGLQPGECGPAAPIGGAGCGSPGLGGHT